MAGNQVAVPSEVRSHTLLDSQAQWGHIVPKNRKIVHDEPLALVVSLALQTVVWLETLVVT